MRYDWPAVGQLCCLCDSFFQQQQQQQHNNDNDDQQSERQPNGQATTEHNMKDMKHVQLLRANVPRQMNNYVCRCDDDDSA